VAERKRLTDAIVRRLPTPEQGKHITPDSEVVGFGARVTANGARSYVLRYTTRAGRERTYTIGDATVWRLPRKRPGTARDYEGLLRLHIEPHFGQHTKVADVRFEDVDALHRKITKAGSPYSANRAMTVLSKMFALAVRWHMRETNPCRGVERNVEYHRRRYLSGDELIRLTRALARHSERQAADAIRLLLLTGARRGEVLGMRWEDLQDGIWSKPPSSTKQKQHHQIPLSAPAQALLADIRKRQRPRTEFVFPGLGTSRHLVELKRSWRRIIKAAGIEDLHVHDLRHSYASQLVSGGASLPLIGALLGHSNPNTTARYAHLFHDPLRAATEKVGAVIAAAGKPVKPPIKLRRGGAS
jgi:integrase